MRRVLASAVALAALLFLVGLPAPAHAGNGDWYRLVNTGPGGVCLDSNYAGDVYALPCSENNDFQRWYLWFGGWTKNRQTGRCLTLKPGWELRTELCDQNNIYQYWNQWSGGWIRNPNDGACVHHFNITRVIGAACHHSSSQFWTQLVF